MLRRDDKMKFLAFRLDFNEYYLNQANEVHYNLDIDKFVGIYIQKPNDDQSRHTAKPVLDLKTRSPALHQIGSLLQQPSQQKNSPALIQPVFAQLKKTPDVGSLAEGSNAYRPPLLVKLLEQQTKKGGASEVIQKIRNSMKMDVESPQLQQQQQQQQYMTQHEQLKDDEDLHDSDDHSFQDHDDEDD